MYSSDNYVSNKQNNMLIENTNKISLKSDDHYYLLVFEKTLSNFNYEIEKELTNFYVNIYKSVARPTLQNTTHQKKKYGATVQTKAPIRQAHGYK